jgi:hypothetical protein
VEVSNSDAEAVYNFSLPVSAGEVLALDYINAKSFATYLFSTYDGFPNYQDYPGGQLFSAFNFTDPLTGDGVAKSDADFQTYVTIPGGSVVSAAPEPGAWALTLGGIGAIGGGLRLARSGRREPDLCGIAGA